MPEMATGTLSRNQKLDHGTHMKHINFPSLFSVSVLRITICGLFIAGAQLSFAADGGRLVIKRSPTLAHNLAVTITIDGKLAGSLTRGRTYETNLAAGK